MNRNIVLCGVGGQGILTISKILVNAAMKQGLVFKQAEVHGMSQRGGSVYAHFRVSDRHIYSPIIPAGEADLVLSMEPLEALRHAHSLKKGGFLISSSVKLPNISYDEKPVIAELKRLKATLVDSKTLAINAGNPRGENMVLLGAAAEETGLGAAAIRGSIKQLFAPKGEKIIESNLEAFGLGLEA